MRKIVIHCETNTVGTDLWEFVEVEDDITDNQLDDLAYEYAVSNAESYGIYPPHEDDDDDAAEDADESIGGAWYDYVPEKHDRHTMGSGEPSWS